MDVDESALVRAAQAGDALAMAQLIDALAPQVGRICGPIALEEGRDASQEALLLIFRDLRKLREPKALRGWVRRIATREAIRHAQRARREPAIDAPAERLPASDDPALARDVRTVLQSLTPEQRAILVLRDLEGLSEQEAAAQLAVAHGTAKSRLHRARAAFAARWRS
jgi:RNA polymerase sigma-70 factor (ECF subfamily)